MPLYLYILRRLVFMIPLLLGITLVSFVIANAIPADPITANLGQKSMSDPQIVAAFRAEWGLDQPKAVQYLVYLRNLLSGNLGKSIRSRRPVLDDLQAYLPATFELATTATFLGVALGLILGILSAVLRNSLFDYLARFFSLIGISAPVFWLALLALLIFYAHLHWLPGPGRLDATLTAPPAVTGFLTVDSLLAGDWRVLGNALAHLVLPSLVLGSYSAGLITRITRSSMLEALTQDYIRTARSKGLRERVVLVRHAFGNALIPVITVIGLSYGSLLSGAVLTETIFAWPGIGRYAYRASTTLDFPAIMGVSLLIAFIFTVINLVVDVLYHLADPRLRAR
jgi:peptide/nickel transport system permease protein